MRRISIAVLIPLLLTLLVLPGFGNEHSQAVADEAPAASAFILIEDAAPTDPQLLVRQLQQVLPKTMVVKLAKSPNKRDVKLEVTNVKDLRALANKIPYGSVESIDDRTRTIVVEY
jgi:hypothetical protein